MVAVYNPLPRPLPLHLLRLPLRPRSEVRVTDGKGEMVEVRKSSKNMSIMKNVVMCHDFVVSMSFFYYFFTVRITRS